MTNTLELELALKRARKTKREFAKYLEISEMALYNKMHNYAEFKASEILKAENFLNLNTTETKKIFFNPKVI